MQLLEAQSLLKEVKPGDQLVLLDEQGKAYSSSGFAGFIEKKMVASVPHLIFVVGGPYGYAQHMYDRADHLLSLSPMTFTHDMARLIFMEQLYRAFSIIAGLPYHHT